MVDVVDITVYIFKFMSSSANFQASRKKELNGLFEKKIFEVIHIDNLFAKARVFESRFINQMKNEEIEKAFEKSRLMIQVFNNSKKQKILTQTPIIQRASQRLIIALSLTISQLSLYLRDIIQAYIQSRSQLNKDVFIFVSTEMKLSLKTILRVILSFYKIAESDTH